MKHYFRIIVIAVLSLQLLSVHSVVIAQSEGAVVTPEESSANASAENTQGKLANWRGILESIEQALSREGIGDDELAQFSSEANSIRLKAQQLDSELSPQLSQLRVQLEELGPGPKEGETAESAEIKNKRALLDSRFADFDGLTKSARLIAIRAAQFEQRIVTERRNRFVAQISRHSTSFFDLNLWTAFWEGLKGTPSRFFLFVSESASSLKAQFVKTPLLGIMSATLAVLLVLTLLFLRSLIARKQKKIEALRTDGDQETSRLVTIRAAGLLFLRNGILPALALYLFGQFFGNFVPGIERMQILIQEITFAVGGLLIARSLVQIFVSPHNSTQRLAALSDSLAGRISTIILYAVAAIAFFRILVNVSIILVAPLEVSIVLGGVLAAICFVSTFLVLMAIAASTQTGLEMQAVQRNFVRWGYLNPLFWIAASVGIVALATGYIAFAEFLTWQILIASIVFSVLWLVIELLDISRARYLHSDSSNWLRLSHATGFSRQTVLQGGVFGFGLAKLLAICIASAVFMVSWGYRAADWAGPVSEAFFGFKVGGLSISFASIALGILLFILGIVLTRAIQHWLRVQFLPTTSMDPGLRNSITTVLGYAGIVIAAILSITAAGLDLSKVAIVAGALSVGIGFGLQSIVNNFVSGLILLAERPIKSGDWIVTSGGEGTVRKTSVRSTEIETFDGATIIIPNSTLITDSVTNWTHHNQKGRIRIHIGVGYDSEPEIVREVLLSCAQNHDRVVTSPAPVVFFQDFGADALTFELRAYLADINNSVSVKSDLRFAILEALRKAKIEIPYPQRDIHIKSGEIAGLAQPVKPLRARAAKKKTV